MDAVIAGDSQKAYQIWHPHPSFSYQDFLSFWGPNGYYSPIKSYRIESAEVPPKGGSGRGGGRGDQRLRSVSEAGRNDKIRAEPRSAAVGRALRPVDELSPALGPRSTGFSLSVFTFVRQSLPDKAPRAESENLKVLIRITHGGEQFFSRNR